MPQPPVTDEITATLARFFFGGVGPSHSKITNITTRTGYGGDDPYSPATQSPNKEIRIRTVLTASQRRPARARELVEALLVELRVYGCFDPGGASYDSEKVQRAQRAFKRAGWALSDEGVLSPTGAIDLTTGGRMPLDEHIDRLRRAADDPGQLLGSAKDLLEAVAKFVLEEISMTPGGNPDFNHVWYLARERLGVLPEQVDSSLPGANNIKTILQSSWKIAEQVNKLRGLQGTGHGRTLPTGVTPEMALMVVREACSVAEFTLTRLDRLRG
jgi:hypothetical protein